MDRMVYVAMTGARQAMLSQTVNANNLANSSTLGFRADLHEFESEPVPGPGFESRVNVTAETPGWNFEPGPMQETGRALDVAVQGRGWMAVQGPDGAEVYTRAGDLRFGAGGVLINGTGQVVLGDGGPIAVPPFEQITIGDDGTVSIVPLGQSADTLATIDRIRLVDPEPTGLFKDSAGLIRLRDGAQAEADASVRLASGVVEGSNVNAVASMISMLELTRHFELQVKLMQAADDNAAQAARLMQLS